MEKGNLNIYTYADLQPVLLLLLGPLEDLDLMPFLPLCQFELPVVFCMLVIKVAPRKTSYVGMYTIYSVQFMQIGNSKRMEKRFGRFREKAKRWESKTSRDPTK